MPTLYDPTWHPERSHDPEYVWRHLANGNTRYVTGTQAHPRLGDEDRRAVLHGQSPHAAVLGCCDSRVPPELIFDQGLGDLFTVRTAGTVLDDVVLGSLEFAVENLGVPLVVVLGHQACGAIAAACHAAERKIHLSGNVASVLSGVTAAALTAPSPEREYLQVHAVHAGILEHSPTIREAVGAGRLALIGSYYSLETGEVTRLT
ncbi:MAG: carbonic anhydrase [Actinobacteria bacterium]|nr:carbonic anhydrase [Actinomycetota bacterium]